VFDYIFVSKPKLAKFSLISIGIMEYWNNGKMGKYKDALNVDHYAF